MKQSMKRLKGLTAVIGLLGVAAVASAQQYPSQPVRIVLPYSAGTGIDAVARVAADGFRGRLGQPVIVENKVGAAGNIGTDTVVKAAPDGHTVLLVANTLTMNPSLYSLPFDTVKDLQPVSLFVKGTLVLAVGPSVAAQSLNDFVAAIKAQPGKFNYASPGIGTPQHLAMELLKKTANIDIVHIPHKGAADAMTSLVGGRVEAMFAPLQTALPHFKSNRLRALAVASPVRHAALRDVPTVAETLKSPEFDVDLWYGLFVPAGTPKPIVERLNAEARAVLGSAEMSKILAVQGMAATPSTPEELSKLVRSDMTLWSKVIKDAGIKAQ